MLAGMGLPELLRSGLIEELAGLRAAGNRVVGYFCLYTPIELIAAAGAIPVRLQRGGFTAEQSGERYVRSDACSFCKSCLGNFESDRLYRLCDAVIGVSTCDMMRRLPELIQRNFGIPAFSLYLPRTAEPLPHRIAEFERQLRWLAGELGALTGTAVTAAQLNAAADRYDRLRQALRSADERRREVPPGIAGSAVLDLVTVANLIGPEAGSELATAAAGQPQREMVRVQRPRLALGGSIVAEDDRWFVRLVETKADIVTDFLCTGTRWFAEDLGPLGADNGFAGLARYYFCRVPCAHRRPNDAFFDYARARVRDFGVQGLVYKTMLYCDPWALERTRLGSELGLPVLHIDSTYSVENREQVRTRLEAFLENL